MKLRHIPFFIFSLLLICAVIYANESYNRFSSDFQTDWNWDQLLSKAGDEKAELYITNLRQNLSLEEARFLLKQLSRIQYPNDIKKFTEFAKLQVELGGSFYGMLPDHFSGSDSIPTPGNFTGLMETAWYLAQTRDENYRALSNPAYKYRTEFSLKPFPAPPKTQIPDGMKYEIDLSAITDLLELYDKNSVTMEDAERIAANPAFREMLNHRRNLGYIPEPLPDEDDLARFIFLSSNRDPLPMLWKWLNPCNYFGLADLFINRAEYQQIVDTLQANQQSISQFVLGRIAKFTPHDFKFQDRLNFAVNFGIRSWATESGFGTNLVSFKDDYDCMLETITHETFHRVQLQLCPIDSSRMKNKVRNFEDLTYHAYQKPTDQKFYEILSYIFLEGTATYVGTAGNSPGIEQNLAKGKELFEQCYQAIYSANDLKKADELLNQGLKSNGPFYALGYHMCEVITNRINEKQLGQIMSQGGLAFFNKFLEINGSDQMNKASFFSPVIISRLADMNIKL